MDEEYYKREPMTWGDFFILVGLMTLSATVSISFLYYAIKEIFF